MSDGQGSSRDALDRGLAEAFGDQQRARPAPSVLAALRTRTGTQLDLHLDAGEPDDAPVRVTEDARKLRDPSGRYQVLGEIGRGGVGVVYKGRDHDLGRDVAMKVLKDEYAERPDVLARFVEEAQIGGQLQHPGIVPVYELGLQAGERPYFAMKLVKGETLAAQLARRSSPADERRRLLGVFEQVCQTVAYAHARRVIHRDLKPANVMIGAFGEVQVVDWGFAKVLAKGGTADEAQSAQRASERSVIETVRSKSESSTHSQPGSMMGTPAYMPPEQAQGDVARVDRRSDVFALGAILCEILTGEPPYREADGDLVRQAANAQLDGALQRLRECDADEALVSLCTECLAPARRARPESAVEVAERVAAHLTSVEERARIAELDAAEARYRHRTTLVASAAGLALVLLGAGSWIWIDGQAQERRAEAAQRVATAMSAASGARGKAQAGGLDATLWDVAAANARQAVELAASDDVDFATRAEARSLAASIDAEREAAATEAAQRTLDVGMLARLEDARIPLQDDVLSEARKIVDSQRMDAAYASAFAEYLGGVSVLEGPDSLVLAGIRAGGIDLTLALALDHWSLVRDRLHGASPPPDAVRTARLRRLAQALDPDDEQRRALRALLPRSGEDGAALREFADRADLAALTADGCRVLAEALCHAGEKEAVVAVLRRGLEFVPDDFGLCVELALHLEMLPETPWAEALTAYRIAHALRPDHFGVLHRLGVSLERLDRAVEAERVFRRVVALEPGNAHVLCHLGWVLSMQGKAEEAVRAFEQALEADPTWSDAHRMMGVVQSERGEQEAALASWRRAVELAPANPIHRYNLGTGLLESGRAQEAVEQLRRATELHPGFADAFANLGIALSDAGEPEQAAVAYRRALELQPGRARVLHNLGNALRDLGDLDGAREAYESALEYDPRFTDSIENLGNLHVQGREFEAAIERYALALEIDPGRATIHHNLGYAHWEAGRMEEAAASFRRALQIDPGFDRSRRMLDRIEKRDVLESVLVGEVRAGSPTDWANAVELGCRSGRFREVVALTEATLRESPELVSGAGWGAYNSACAAARLAADGAPEVSEAERSRGRDLGRTWLAAEVAVWGSWLSEGGVRADEARRRLSYARSDPDLQTVRGERIDALPDAEREGWRALWESIRQLLPNGG